MAKRTTQVFVGNLGTYDDKAELKDLFSIYGPVRKVWVARNPPGFGYIEFAYAFDASEACLNLDGKVFFGRRIRVELSRYDLTHRGDTKTERSRRAEPRDDRYRLGKRDYDSYKEAARDLHGSDFRYTIERSAIYNQNAGSSSTAVDNTARERSPSSLRNKRSAYSPDDYDTRSSPDPHESSVIVDEYNGSGSRESSPGYIIDEYIAEPDGTGDRKRRCSNSPSPCSSLKRPRTKADLDRGS